MDEPMSACVPRIGPLRDVAGAEQHHIVARARDVADHAGKLRGVIERRHAAVPARAGR